MEQSVSDTLGGAGLTPGQGEDASDHEEEKQHQLYRGLHGATDGLDLMCSLLQLLVNSPVFRGLSRRQDEEEVEDSGKEREDQSGETQSQQTV